MAQQMVTVEWTLGELHDNTINSSKRPWSKLWRTTKPQIVFYLLSIASYNVFFKKVGASSHENLNIGFNERSSVLSMARL